MSDKRPKNEKRSAAMTLRMADPVARERAKANLKKGQDALAKKRADAKAASGAPPPDPKPPKAEGATTTTRTTRRAVGVGRWRGL